MYQCPICRGLYQYYELKDQTDDYKDYKLCPDCESVIGIMERI